jgi:hypothetical protein
MTEHQPGWHPDPGGRHEHRYWDGSRWTDDVADLEDLGGLDGLGIGGIDETDFDPADMIGSVARIYEESLGLSSSQARCLAEELVGAFDAFDDEYELDDVDAFGSAFDAFDTCGISLADLSG